MSDPNGYSRTDLIRQGCLHAPERMALVETTARWPRSLRTASMPSSSAAGRRPRFGLEAAAGRHAKFVAFFNAGKIAAARCHGTMADRGRPAGDGRQCRSGRTLAGFAVREDNPVSGPQNCSGAETARRVIEALER